MNCQFDKKFLSIFCLGANRVIGLGHNFDSPFAKQPTCIKFSSTQHLAFPEFHQSTGDFWRLLRAMEIEGNFASIAFAATGCECGKWTKHELVTSSLSQRACYRRQTHVPTFPPFRPTRKPNATGLAIADRVEESIALIRFSLLQHSAVPQV